VFSSISFPTTTGNIPIACKASEFALLRSIIDLIFGLAFSKAIINSTAFDYLSTFVKDLLDFIEAH